MSKLLAAGDRLDGKEIIVSGFVCSERDSADGLFLTADDCERSNYDNAIRLHHFEHKSERTTLVRLRGKFSSLHDVVRTDDPYLWGELEVNYRF